MPYISSPPGRSAPFENHHFVTGVDQLLRGSKTRGSTAHHGDLLPRTLHRCLGLDPAFFKPTIGDGDLDLFDRDRVFVDPQHASRFTRRRTDAAGELGKVVCAVQSIERFSPLAVIDQIVPIGNEIAQGATAYDKKARHSPCSARLAGRDLPQARSA